MTNENKPFVVACNCDALGGQYPEPMVKGRFASFREAWGACKQLGHRHAITHEPSGLTYYEIDRGPGWGRPEILWLDADGISHPAPVDVA